MSRWETTLSEMEEALIEKQAKEKETKADVDRLNELHEKMKKEIVKLKEELEGKEEETIDVMLVHVRKKFSKRRKLLDSWRIAEIKRRVKGTQF